MIYARTSRSVKTHNGVHTEFLRLTLNNPRWDRDLRSFLRRSYGFKSNADYFIEHNAPVSSDEAVAAIAWAGRFIEKVAETVQEDSAP